MIFLHFLHTSIPLNASFFAKIGAVIIKDINA